ncbi:MAG: peptidoglycan DD-metalloendopeptidase family protein [Xanthomonadales bacterium]|nr:peptidoglycan DD-metalloendopeptidase family protein [Xanthomonadales bacterium]
MSDPVRPRTAVPDFFSACRHLPRSLRRRHWLSCAVVTGLSITVLGVLPGLAVAKRDTPAYLVQTALELPQPTQSIDPGVTELGAGEALQLAYDNEEGTWQTVEVARGDTLGGIFQRQGFPANTLERALASSHVQEIAGRLRPGARLAFHAAEAGRLDAMMFDRGEDARVLIRLLDDGSLDEQLLERQVQYRVERGTGVIESSLSAAAQEAGLSYNMVLKVARVLGYDIDFAQDLRVGDSFAVIYEQVFRDGEHVRDGDVLAVSFINRGRRVLALRHVHADGKIEYFDQDGRPLRREFLRTPVDFTRISSRFSLTRKHPVLNRVRAHRGVDYAAPTGTPIYAAGDGRVQFRGRQGGYGNTIILDHGNQTTTLYAHMSRFNQSARQGSRVRQGDIIGYVGATGLATGPHLHYEFRVKGSHRDPLTVTLPKPEPLKGPALDRFQRDTVAIAAQLELLESLRATASVP